MDFWSPVTTAGSLSWWIHAHACFPSRAAPGATTCTVVYVHVLQMQPGVKPHDLPAATAAAGPPRLRQNLDLSVSVFRLYSVKVAWLLFS